MEKWDQDAELWFCVIERLTKWLARSCDLRAGLEDEAIEPVKARTVLSTRYAVVPPKLLERAFEALNSFIVRPWLGVLAIVFRVCFPVLSWEWAYR